MRSMTPVEFSFPTGLSIILWRVGHASNAGMLSFTCACPDLIETGIDDPWSRLSQNFSRRLFYDFAVKGQDYVLGIRVGGDGDRFAEGPKGLCAIFGFDIAGFTRLDGVFGVIRGRTAAGGLDGFQNQIGGSGVSECEPVFDRDILLNLAKFEGSLSECDRGHSGSSLIRDGGHGNWVSDFCVGRFLLAGCEQSGGQEQGKEKLFHFHKTN